MKASVVLKPLFMDYHNQNQVAIKIIRTYSPNMNPVMEG
jgi:hypothetical protein